ncbi:MAG: DUF4926 domain-containing protein [Candidatus Woykebacteria bacterium RBG_16_43_9]|uniref:DUF4926 domain-containing protein n=1 Tax=Candidatus Woykebacteria bacterium RBG_16_43_9 TaxID=1802596 RepID=A0A1G1WCP6_9BACT|nr:MAG: DUF4926 domain-containing protein [Candidatus Woykebacteria bacterium RBG_16_43_9]
MFKELDTVVLTHNIDKYNLEKGDVGTLVHVYDNEKAIEVEVVRADGRTVAVLTLESKDVRNISKEEILKVREFAASV